MDTSTIDALEVEHSKIGKMLAELKAKAETASVFPLTINMPILQPGELWAGLIISADGQKRHHLVLLPGDNDDASWQKQMNWAEKSGGDLPDRTEQALLFATMKDQFQECAYWSNTEHAAYSDFAWGQYFGYGGQDGHDKSAELRARAVRRVLVIQ